MASGGCLNIAEEGPHCTPCVSKGKKVAFYKYCLDCEAHYCAECFELHPRVPFLAKHTVLSKDDERRWSRIQYKCATHGRNIEFFCTIHNKVACQICINLQHRKCDSIDFIPECSKEINTNRKLISTVDRIGDIIETVRSYEQNFEKKSQTNQYSKQSFLKTLSDFRHSINGLLDGLERLTKKSMEQRFEDNARYFNESITELRKLKGELEELKCDLNTTAKEKGVLVFIRFTEGIEMVKEAERKIAQLKSKNNKERFKLAIDGKLEQLLKSITSFGSIVDEQNMASDELSSSGSDAGLSVEERSFADVSERSFNSFRLLPNKAEELIAELSSSESDDGLSAEVRSGADISERSFSSFRRYPNKANEDTPSSSYQSVRGGGSNLQIFVRFPDCTSVVLNVGKDETIGNIKRKLMQKEGKRCPANFFLTYGSKRLPDHKTVSDCHLKANYNLHLH